MRGLVSDESIRNQLRSVILLPLLSMNMGPESRSPTLSPRPVSLALEHSIEDASRMRGTVEAKVQGFRGNCAIIDKLEATFTTRMFKEEDKFLGALKRPASNVIRDIRLAASRILDSYQRGHHLWNVPAEIDSVDKIDSDLKMLISALTVIKRGVCLDAEEEGNYHYFLACCVASELQREIRNWVSFDKIFKEFLWMAPSFVNHFHQTAGARYIEILLALEKWAAAKLSKSVTNDSPQTSSDLSIWRRGENLARNCFDGVVALIEAVHRKSETDTFGWELIGRSLVWKTFLGSQWPSCSELKPQALALMSMLSFSVRTMARSTPNNPDQRVGLEIAYGLEKVNRIQRLGKTHGELLFAHAHFLGEKFVALANLYRKGFKEEGTLDRPTLLKELLPLIQQLGDLETLTKYYERNAAEARIRRASVPVPEPEPECTMSKLEDLMGLTSKRLNFMCWLDQPGAKLASEKMFEQSHNMRLEPEKFENQEAMESYAQRTEIFADLLRKKWKEEVHDRLKHPNPPYKMMLRTLAADIAGPLEHLKDQESRPEVYGSGQRRWSYTNLEAILRQAGRTILMHWSQTMKLTPIQTLRIFYNHIVSDDTQKELFRLAQVAKIWWIIDKDASLATDSMKLSWKEMVLVHAAIFEHGTGVTPEITRECMGILHHLANKAAMD